MAGCHGAPQREILCWGPRTHARSAEPPGDYRSCLSKLIRQLPSSYRRYRGDQTMGSRTGDWLSLSGSRLYMVKAKTGSVPTDMGRLLLGQPSLRAGSVAAAGYGADFWSLYSTLSTSASQLASMMFSETPTVPQIDCLSRDSITTRTRAAVPARAFTTRTL
jgi:hypothetical protein